MRTLGLKPNQTRVAGFAEPGVKHGTAVSAAFQALPGNSTASANRADPMPQPLHPSSFIPLPYFVTRSLLTRAPRKTVALEH